MSAGSWRLSGSKFQTVGPVTEKARRPKVVWPGDVEWLTVNDVGLECLRLLYRSRPGTQEFVLQTAMHCDSQFVVYTFWDVEPVQFLV